MMFDYLASYHEAGHAVVFAGLGARVTQTSVYRDMTGCCQYETGTLDTIGKSAGSIAGVLAESMVGNSRAFESFAQDNCPPRESDATRIGGVTASDWSELIAHCGDADHARRSVRLARRILKAEWPRVKKLAKRLQRDGDISGAELRKYLPKRGVWAPSRKAAKVARPQIWLDDDLLIVVRPARHCDRPAAAGT